MFIEISGGQSGIAEYLRDGRKRDRAFSRDFMDKRVTLNGDLDITDSVIKNLNFKENYHHITLSFKEDFVSIDDLQRASNEFEKFVKAAYKDSEINYYAEAHLPKLKSYKSQSGELIIRKPHIHIVIPNVNLESGKYLEPFAYVNNNIQYIDAFKELHNEQFGFESPKDNMSNKMNIESTIISRQKGDIFERNKAEKEEILNFILENKVSDYNEFQSYLKSQGILKERNQNKPNSYLNLKLKHHSQGMNLKEFCFSKKFIEEYSYEDKIDFLLDKTEEKFFEKKETYQSQQTLKYETYLKDWFDYKAKEIKYINYNSKFYKEQYKSYTRDEKIIAINKLEKEFYEKNNLKNELNIEFENIQIANSELNVEFSNNIDNVVSQKLTIHDEELMLEKIDFSNINLENAYEILKSERGVLNEKYKLNINENTVETGSIKLGVREFIVEQVNLNAKEINLLESQIRTIAKKFNLQRKDSQMKINTNIVTNLRNRNQIDYLQIGTVDKLGRMTGIIYDQADNERKSSGLAYVIKDKIVDYEEFIKVNGAKEILDKKSELAQSQFSSYYSKILKCNYQKEDMTLTQRGQSYANSQFNLRNEMKAVDFGITKFSDSRKLDKNLFTLAKEFVLEKYHDFKDKMEMVFKSKSELAATNVQLAVELQQMKQSLQEIKDYNQALEAKANNLEKEQNENAKGDSIKEKTIDEIEKEAREEAKKQAKEEFVELAKDKSHLITDLKENDINSLSSKELNAGKLMLNNDLKIENKESIQKLVQSLEKIKEIVNGDVSLDFATVLDGVLKGMKENQNLKENLASSKEQERDR